MNIPILHHNFDATGLELFYDTPFEWLFIIIVALLISFTVVGMLFLAKKIFKKLNFYQKMDESQSSIYPGVILISFSFLAAMLMLPIVFFEYSILSNAPKFFSSDKDSGTILKPVESVDNLPEDDILSELGLIRKYDENNILASRYNDEFVKEMKNNEKMKEYTIPECELNDPESIICGGDKLSSVQANKDDKKVTLTPHVEIDSDKADIDVDNPKDKGVKVYYWIEETE